MLAPLLKTHTHKIIVLLVVTFFCYINVVKNGYALDDQFVTTAEHALVSKGFGGIKEIFTSNYSSIGGKAFEYRPLAVFTYAIEYQFFGFKPPISHFINLLLYLLLIALVYQVLTMLLPTNVEMPFWITFIFALHPLHNEVVVSLKNREEILVAIFGFVSLRLLLVHLNTGKKSALFYSFLAFLIGHFAKTTIAPFAFLMVFSAWYFNKGTIKKLAPLFVVYLALGQFFYWTGYALMSNGFMRTFDVVENPLTQVAFVNRIPTAFSIFARYVQLFVWPNPLLCYYGLGSIAIAGWTDVSFLLGLGLVGVFIYLVMREFKERSLLGYGIFIFIFLISPYLNFPVLAPGLMAERFAFLAVLGFAILLIALLTKYLKQQQVQWVLLLLGLIYVVINTNRTPDWKSLISLLEADANKEVTSVKLLTALAESYQAMAGKETNNEQLRANYLKKAEEGYLKVIKIYPEHGGAYNNLGTLYASAGKLSEAETCLQKALNLGFVSADSYYNLGAIYELSGKRELAMQYYHKCLGVSPNYAQAIERLNVITSNKQPTTQK